MDYHVHHDLLVLYLFLEPLTLPLEVIEAELESLRYVGGRWTIDFFVILIKLHLC